ncbi:MAG: LON peptidase substrate-binding domain-containing protein [Deltaproteobacteria bacterium]|nr:LON peptidase substrate-binding domain-containing protein [Deltaproteobacteria bacterium]
MDWLPSTPLTAEELACLPVFPLPRVVFFPGTALPLHLFEPRYRRMAEDCFETGPKAMAVTLLAPGWEEDYEGDPPIYEVAGAGRIVGHQLRPDGTHDIILHGLRRVRLEELPSDHVPYRLARAVPIEDTGTAASADVLAMMAVAMSVASRVRERQPDFLLQVSAELPAGRAADVVADQLVVGPEDRQRILQTVDVKERVALVTEAVGSLLAQLSEAHAPS